MISYLKGKIIEKSDKNIILLINNIGYQVTLPTVVLEKLKINQEVEFFIFSHIKEDAWDLYGFFTLAELDFFKLLITVPGIGPKSALSILNGAKVSDIKKALFSGDESVFQKVTGVGKKNAEKIIVELKNKIVPDFADNKKTDAPADDNLGDWQTIEALTSLGYNEHQARQAIKKIPGEITDLDNRIREALKILGRK